MPPAADSCAKPAVPYLTELENHGFKIFRMKPEVSARLIRQWNAVEPPTDYKGDTVFVVLHENMPDRAGMIWTLADCVTYETGMPKEMLARLLSGHDI